MIFTLHKPELNRIIDVLCVYGPSYVTDIYHNLLPALERQVGISARLNLVNYDTNKALFRRDDTKIPVLDWSSDRCEGRIGFGEAINYLFKKTNPNPIFVIANPDTVPTPTALKILVETITQRAAGIVEARQWPYEHPKEYETETLQTPWASGAFFIAASVAFEQIGGFDELFFMYNEDVDLSWRMRLAGKDVLYQPDALIYHYTGLGKYHSNVFYLEHYYSIRNFLFIAYKFWGKAGESLALKHLERSSLPSGFKKSILQDYEGVKPKIIRQAAFPPDRWIKILGLNQYHSIRDI